MATAKRDGGKAPVNVGANPYAEFDAEFAWDKVNEESPTMVEFETPGEFVIGSYNGALDVHTENVKDDSKASDGKPGFTIQTFRDIRDQSLIALPNSYKLAEALSEIPVGAMCKVLYVKDVPMGSGRNPMKDIVVYTSK